MPDLEALANAPPQPWVFGASQIESIDEPVLVLWGDESFLAGPSAALAEALPDAEGRVITGTDHALITEDPRAVAEAIGEFIARH